MARPEVHVALVVILLVLAPAIAQAGGSLASAHDAYAQGDYPAAASAYNDVLGEYPAHTDAWLGLARAYTALGQWQRAADAYGELVQLGPVAVGIRQEYGDALREAGDLEHAVAQYNYALEGAPGDDLLMRAIAADDAGRQAEACALYEDVVAQYPKHATGWHRLAQLRVDLGRWQPACDAYEMLLTLGPVTADVRQNYGDALREAGRLDLAIEQYNLVLAAGDGAPHESATMAAPYPTLSYTAPHTASSVAPMNTASTPVPVNTTPSPTPVTDPSAAALITTASPLPPADSFSMPGSNQATVAVGSWGLVAEVIEPVAPALSRNDGGGYTETEFSAPVVMYAQARPRDAIPGVMNFSTMATEEQPEQNETDDADIDWLAEARRRAEGKYWEDAVAAYRKHMETTHADIALRLEYANALREARMLEEAMDEFNRVLHADAENLDARLGVAKVLALQGNLEDAMLLLEQLYVDAESGNRAQLTMAYCYFVNGYLNEAFSDIGEVLIRLPQNREAVELILAGHSATVAGWNEIHDMLAQYPENDEALALLDEIVDTQKQLYMQMPVGPFGRAEVLFQGGEYELSLREYEAILRKDPKNIRAWRRLGTLYTWEEDWEEAIAAYESYLTEAPNDAEARLRYAQVLLWGGYPQEARDELESLLSDVDIPIDTYEAALVVYAETLNATGEGEQALRSYEEALMFDSHNINARLGYANTLAGMKRYDDAIAQYELALREDPTHEAAKLGLARTHAWKGDLKKAQELYDRVYADGGHYTASRVGKAYAYLWEGKREKARELAEEAARLNPNNPDVDVLLAQLAAVADPVLAVHFSQSHDSDDNDYSGVVTTASVPLDSEGARVVISHEDFKLDNTGRAEESAGTHTKFTMSVPLSEQSRVQGTVGYLDIDNGVDPGLKEWTWSTSFTTDLSDRATVGLGYASQVFYDTSWLARTGVRLRETVLSGDFDLSGDKATRLLAHYGHGELSDGNSRNTWSLNLRRTQRERGVGQLNYGIAHRSLSYAQDMNNGYWDPSDYYYSEIYADWLDLSDRSLRLDGGLGYGWDEMTGYGGNGLFRYNAGIRAYVGELVLRTGYKSSEAPTTTTVTPGYEYESWYFTGEYRF